MIDEDYDKIIKELEELLKAAQDDAKEAEDYVEELEAENHLLRTSGIAEVAVRNPSVMEYMQHWEGRALDAEAKLAEAVDALKFYAEASWSGLDDDIGFDANWQSNEPGELARATIAELKG